ncbi:hypothetical protein [Salinibacter altiplanensis]|uniref:hypothetical protein n=1 Tax=Salinibacter altiplanensis TaxID=1803181 RepID=UPI000C9EEBC0|nr:hypothetical protein [Salinibacter altiplanensis]
MPDVPRCGAENRDGAPCGLPAGWGTDHKGEGRCKHHGGATEGAGAPEGNKNAVTTGEHESIFYDTLGEKEQELWHAVDADQLAQLDEQIRLINIRERRMLKRIQRIKRQELTLTARETEEGAAPSAGASVQVDTEREQHTATIERIQRIEKALTRVQAEHRKLIREKYRILKDQPADNSEKLDELLGRMSSMRDDAGDYQSPESG